MATSDAQDWPRDQPSYVAPSNDGVTRVVHLKRYLGNVIQDCDVYIGRRNGMGGWDMPQSKWANPFKLKQYNNSRRDVIRDYRDYVTSKPELMNALHELRGKRLGCWCKPEACHGDVLVELVNKHCSVETQPQGQSKVKVTPEGHTQGSAGASMFDLNEDFPALGAGPQHDGGGSGANMKDANTQYSGQNPELHDSNTHSESKANHLAGKEEASGETTQGQPEVKVKDTKVKIKGSRRNRQRMRTPHPHMKNVNTPKWQTPP